MNFKNIVLSGTVITMLTGIALPATVNASAVNSNVNTIQTSVNTTRELDKLSRYVTLDTSKKQFMLISTAKNYLSTSEIAFINKSIAKSNSIISDDFKDSSLSVSIENDSVKVEPRYFSNSSGFRLLSINKHAYWDYEMHWWGASVFLSHSFVNKLKAYSTVITGAGAAGAGAALKRGLTLCGMGGRAAGIIGAAAGVEAAIYFDQITNRCSSTGVFVDANWVGGCSIYSA